MPNKTATGANQILTFVFEDAGSYNQDPSSVTDTNFKPFGVNETMGSQDRNNNPTRQYRPFSRAAQEVLEGSFDGSWSIDATLTNAHFLRTIYGDPSTGGSGDVYNFTLDPRAPPRTMQIIEETHYSDGEIEQTVFQGCATDSVDIDVSVGDPVDISLDGSYATETTRSTVAGDSLAYGSSSGGIAGNGGQPDTLARPLHFGNSELQFGYGGSQSALGLVQDASISYSANMQLEEEIGTRFASAPTFGQFEPDLSFSRIVSKDSADTPKRAMYGGSSVQSPQESIAASEIDGTLVMDAGVSGTTNTFTFNLNGTSPDSFTRNNVGDPENALEEDIDRFISSVDVTVESSVHNLTGP